MNTSYRMRCLVIALLLTGLTACRPASEPSTQASKTTPAVTKMTPQEQSAVASLQWLNNADAARDAANELSQASTQARKVNLIAFARRGISYPGLSKEQLARIGDKVGYKFAEGSGDVIYGPTHRAMRRKLRSYAIAYNQAIFVALQ